MINAIPHARLRPRCAPSRAPPPAARSSATVVYSSVAICPRPHRPLAGTLLASDWQVVHQHTAPRGGGDMATFDEMAADNPNIRSQYDDWRDQRAANGEDPVDWGAFQQHLQAIGAPDPGGRPPDDFVG